MTRYTGFHIGFCAYQRGKGKLADSSAMLSGFRLFSIDRERLDGLDKEGVQLVSVDKLKRR